MDNNGQQWTTMDNNGQQLTTMDKNLQQWTKMDKNGQQWTTIRNDTCISESLMPFLDALASLKPVMSLGH